MKTYFRGLIDFCAEGLAHEEWWHYGVDYGPEIVHLNFEERPGGFLFWADGRYVPVNTPLFECVCRYAMERGVPVFVEP